MQIIHFINKTFELDNSETKKIDISFTAEKSSKLTKRIYKEFKISSNTDIILNKIKYRWKQDLERDSLNDWSES